MPVYEYQCTSCGQVLTAVRSIPERDNGPECCGKSAPKIMSATRSQPVIGGGSFQGYQCVVTDQWVDSRKKRREIMAEHELREKG